MKLNPVKYKWKADNSYGDGFIAHELQEHYPSAVIGQKDGCDSEGNPDYQSISYSSLVGLTVSAIQQQQNKIIELEQKNIELEQKNIELEQQLQNILTRLTNLENSN